MWWLVILILINIIIIPSTLWPPCWPYWQVGHKMNSYTISELLPSSDYNVMLCLKKNKHIIPVHCIVWRYRKQCWFLMIIDQPALYPTIYNCVDLAILLFFCFCDNICKPRWAVFAWQQGPSPICTSLASSRSSSKSTSSSSSSSPSPSSTGLHGDQCGCRCSWPFLLLLYLTHPLQGL